MKKKIGWEGKRWGAYFWFVGWDCFSLGAHVCLGCPNIEIHIPFGFIRIGVTKGALFKNTGPVFIIEPAENHVHETIIPLPSGSTLRHRRVLSDDG